MIISKKYAKKMIKEGRAQEDGRTTDQPNWEQRYNGKTYVVVQRFDFQRTDHYDDEEESNNAK